jgi:GT2 family glycosyltransferase
MTTGISVIIPAYNAAGTLSRTLRSVLAQTLPPLETIVIDDGSSDRTAAVAAAFAPQVRLLRRANGGPGSARNTGIRAACGAWIALLDADDTWAPEKLERQMALSGDPRTGIIACLSDRPGDRCPPELRFADLWRANLLVNSTVLLRRAAWDAVGGFEEQRALIAVEDYNLWLRVAAAGWRILVCQEVLAHYTRGVGISSNTGRLFAASLHNLDRIAAVLALPTPLVQARRLQTLDAFTRIAFYERDLGLARSLGRQAARLRPTPTRLARLALTYVPPPVLNAKRQLARSRPPRLFGRPVVPAAPQLDRPTLLVIIDAEEEFDWNTLPRRAAVQAMAHQTAAQRILERFGCIPTYAVDYAVAAQRDGYAPLLEFCQSGRCRIGAQLHPWLNPPIEEALCPENSYPGNLPPGLELEKLRLLTAVISQNLGVRPTLYRAGRYGLGPHTPAALAALGYRIDCSVRPYFAPDRDGRPDYRDAYPHPFWLDAAQTVLELPVTVGLTGGLSHLPALLVAATHPRLRRLRLGSLLAVSRLADRFQLSPEGTRLADAKRLTRAMLAAGHLLFVVSYHSPSLQPGNTPYVRNAADLQRFLGWLDGYLDFFFGEVGGVAATPDAVYDATRPARAAAVAAA